MIRWIFISLIFLNFAFAQDFTQLGAAFKESFYNQSIYDEYRCASNVYRLLKFANSEGADLSKANVVYVVSFGKGTVDEENRNFLDPNYIPGLYPWPESTRGKAQEWSFHVVLEESGKIYDLDFSNAPQVVDKTDYFMKMFFLPDLNYPNLSLFMRVIPAVNYIQNYTEGTTDEKSNYKEFISGKVNGEIYPLINLIQFLDL